MDEDKEEKVSVSKDAHKGTAKIIKNACVGGRLNRRGVGNRGKEGEQFNECENLWAKECLSLRMQGT